MAAPKKVGTCAVPSCENEARRGFRTCSRACSQLWIKVYRFQVEPDKQALAQARTILANPHKYPPASVRSARRKLGEDVPYQTYHPKLKAGDIAPIRADSRPVAQIAADYKVTPRTIGKIKRREMWKHIP